jgi:hypothetical protein
MNSLPYEAYAALPGINATALKAGARSMLAMREVMTGGGKKCTAAMDWGNLVHAALLQPTQCTELYAVWTGGIKRGGAYDAFEAANAGKTIIKPDEAKELDALIKAVYSKPFAVALLSGCITELCLQWTDPDYGPAKARLDGYMANNGGTLIELKTARSITDRSFASAFYSLGYDIQLGWYAHGLQANNMPVADVWTVAVQTQEELDCRVLHIPKLVLDEGYAKARRLAIEYRACESLKDWPGIDGGKDYTEFVPPVWAVGNTELNMEGCEL